MILHYLVTQLPGAVFGVVFAVFIPGVLRKAKQYFVKETQTAETYIKNEAANIKKKL